MTWKRMRWCCLMEVAGEEILDTSQGDLIDDAVRDGMGNAVHPANSIPSIPSEPLIDFDNVLLPSAFNNTGSDDPANNSIQLEPHQMITVEAIVHNDPNTSVKTNNLTKHVVESTVHNQPITPNVTPKKLPVPSPFKRALSWPEASKKTVKSRNRELMPSVVSSVEYKNYLKTKLEKKAKEEEKKKERVAERARKKSEKEKIKLEKAAEREKKKAMTQATKKLARKKKSKRVVQTSSSEEEDDHEDWLPQDESEENTANEDLEQDQYNDELMQLDHSIIYITPDHENHMTETVNGNIRMTVDELEGSNHHETQEEISSSIEEVIGILPPSLFEIIDEEQLQKEDDVQREEGLSMTVDENPTMKDRKPVEDLSITGEKKESMNDEKDESKKDKNAVKNQTVREGDYISAFMPTKQKKIRVACCVWKIADGKIQAKFMRATNRMKTIFLKKKR